MDLSFKTRSGRSHKVEVTEGKRPFRFRELLHKVLLKLRLTNHKWKWNYTADWDTDFESCTICGAYKDK